VATLSGVKDNCGGDVPAVYAGAQKKEETCTNKYKEDRTWTFTDPCGNQNSHIQTITINDDKGPTFSTGFPEDKSFTCTDPCVTVNYVKPTCTGGTPTAEDNCDSTGVVVSSVDVAAASTVSFFPGTVVTRTWTATDTCGNPTSKNQIITVNDVCSFSVSKAFSGPDINVAVAVINTDAGVKITVTVADVRTGDLRGVFFTVAGDVSKITKISGEHVTSFKIEKGGVDRLSNDVLMKGGGKNANTFDVGVEIGHQGIGQGDDFNSAVFVVAGLTTSDFKGSNFGVRLTSVTDDKGGREYSSKVTGPSVCCHYDHPKPQVVV